MRVVYVLISLLVLIGIWSCSKEITPMPSLTHPAGWNDLNSDVFHGDKVLVVGSESCTQCHGASYTGGTSGVSCYQCHTSYPHFEQWTTPGSGHDAFIKSHNWSLTACQTCHGTDYTGGSSGKSCLNCHTETAGPEACNTCHGDPGISVSDIASWAPPEDLKDNLATSAVGVGAHQKHMPGDSIWTTAYTSDCTFCHKPLNGFDDPVHIDRKSGVDMQFGSVATWNGTVTPQWNKSSATCTNVYCHGNFSFKKSESNNQWIYTLDRISGNNPEVVWNQVGTGQADCGTCHGLPPTGHVAAATCDFCHGSVVDNNNVIIDKSKHINGQVDLN